MQVLSSSDLLQRLCILSGKWGMMVWFADAVEDEWNPEEISRAALWFNRAEDSHLQAACDGYAFLLFDSEGEMNTAFEQTVGDDGPTKLNTYDGPQRIYALTCSPAGQIQNENT